ncbi:MAG: hypothetical protein CL850_02330 [Crocinitomicaceae bacterium]|nr:hypothetical protein [Crocinitomicaceae bacterium]
MELRSWMYILFVACFLSSCTWFNPYEINVMEDDFKCVSYYLPVNRDSSLFFFSRSFDPYNQYSNEFLDFCAEVSTSQSTTTSCGEMLDDTASIWLDTKYIGSLLPGDSVFLSIESPAFDMISSSSVVPEKSQISGYYMSSRTYDNDLDYFDEIVLELNDPSSNDEAYMLQLILHIDTLYADSPKMKSLKSDDVNMIRRKFGGDVLEDALFFDDACFEGGNYTFHFRTLNTLDDGVPYHYTLLVHSISKSMYKFFYDLEAADLTGFFYGGSFSVYSNINGAHGCFGIMQSTPVLLFP